MHGNGAPSTDNAVQLAPPPPLDDNLSARLDLLWQAYLYAHDAGADVWDFALETDKLYDAGLTISDLRWLVAKGLVQHGQETSVYGDSHRSFRASDGFNFVSTTSLVLTPRGAALANRVLRESAATPQSFVSIDAALIASGATAAAQTDPPAAGETVEPPAAVKPHWNSVRRELWLSTTIVKRFRVPARNQQTILSAFQEEDWPERIDDPLSVSGGVDPHTRLHDAINRLNGRQTNHLLRFRGNGGGTGVSWELRNSR